MESSGQKARLRIRALGRLHSLSRPGINALASCGDVIASAGNDETVALVKPSRDATQELFVKARLRGHCGAVRALASARSGNLLASGAADGTVRLWSIQGSVAECVPLAVISVGDDVTALSFNPDGTLLAVVTLRGVTVTHVDDGWTVGPLAFRAKQQQVSVAACTFVPSSLGQDTVVVGLCDGQLCSFSLRAQGAPTLLFQHNGPVTSISFAPSQTIFASCGGGGVQIRDLSAPQTLLWQAGVANVWAVALHQLDGGGRVCLAAASGDEVRLRAWTASQSDQMAMQPLELEAPQGGVACLQWSGSGDLLAVGGAGSSLLHLYDWAPPPSNTGTDG